MLDVNFEGHGIRIKNVDNFVGDTVIIKYKSEIGKPDFEYKLQVTLCVKMHMNKYLIAQKS